MSTRRECILNTVDDYDRKEDEELDRDDIPQAIAYEEITVLEIVAHFEKCLRKGLPHR